MSTVKELLQDAYLLYQEMEASKLLSSPLSVNKTPIFKELFEKHSTVPSKSENIIAEEILIDIVKLLNDMVRLKQGNNIEQLLKIIRTIRSSSEEKRDEPPLTLITLDELKNDGHRATIYLYMLACSCKATCDEQFQVSDALAVLAEVVSMLPSAVAQDSRFMAKCSIFLDTRKTQTSGLAKAKAEIQTLTDRCLELQKEIKALELQNIHLINELAVNTKEFNDARLSLDMNTANYVSDVKRQTDSYQRRIAELEKMVTVEEPNFSCASTDCSDNSNSGSSHSNASNPSSRSSTTQTNSAPAKAAVKGLSALNFLHTTRFNPKAPDSVAQPSSAPSVLPGQAK